MLQGARKMHHREDMRRTTLPLHRAPKKLHGPAAQRASVPGWHEPQAQPRRRGDHRRRTPAAEEPRPAQDRFARCIAAAAAASDAVPLTTDPYVGRSLPYIRVDVGAIPASVAGPHGCTTWGATDGKTRFDAVTQSLTEIVRMHPGMMGLHGGAHERASQRGVAFLVFRPGPAGLGLIDEIASDGRLPMTIGDTVIDVPAKRVVMPDTQDMAEVVLRGLGPGDAVRGVTLAVLTEAGYHDVRVVHERARASSPAGARRAPTPPWLSPECGLLPVTRCCPVCHALSSQDPTACWSG